MIPAYPIVGGKLDGAAEPGVFILRFTRDDETYLGIESKEADGKIVLFYMLSDMAPVDAIKTLRERKLC